VISVFTLNKIAMILGNKNQAIIIVFYLFNLRIWVKNKIAHYC